MRPLLFALGIMYCFCANGQDSTLTVNLSLMVSGSNGPTPFWMRANTNGTIPAKNFYTSGQWGVYKIYNPNNPRLLQWSGGVELITNYSKKGDVFFTDLYAAARLGPVEFLLGQKKNMVSLIDSSLGTGSLSNSANARPFPRFQIAVAEFQPLAFDGFLSVKGSISEGILGPSRINYGSVTTVPNTYFHQKQLYFRLGRYRSPIKVYAGMNHQVLWGGESEIMPVEELNLSKAYWHILTGKTLNRKKVGSNFGTSDIAAEIKIKKLRFFVYRNNIHENGSLFKIINIADGLNGVTISRSDRSAGEKSFFRINSINFEYLSLNSQKNKFNPSELVISQIADYYNSYIYQRGWSYYGSGIGSPLVPLAGLTNTDLPKNNSQFTNNNRIQAFHTAINGSLSEINIILKGTYSRNSGTYLNPFSSEINQISLLLSGEKTLRILKATVFAGVASDIGKIYPNSVAVFLGVRKSGFLN